MQFQLPQFIESEDKVAGSLTLKQLLILSGGGIVAFAFYWIFALWFWLFLSAIIAVICISFAFIKYNGQPLTKVAMSGFSFLLHPKIYLWKREARESLIDENIMAERENLSSAGSGMSSVKKLWSDLVTTKNPLPKREKTTTFQNPQENFSIFRKMTGEREVAKRVDYR